MKDRPLLEVTEVVDDSTGIWHSGEIEFGIHGELDNYLKEYGAEGKEAILATLEFLKKEVARRYEEVK